LSGCSPADAARCAAQWFNRNYRRSAAGVPRLCGRSSRPPSGRGGSFLGAEPDSVSPDAPNIVRGAGAKKMHRNRSQVGTKSITGREEKGIGPCFRTSLVGDGGANSPKNGPIPTRPGEEKGIGPCFRTSLVGDGGANSPNNGPIPTRPVNTYGNIGPEGRPLVARGETPGTCPGANYQAPEGRP